MKEVSKRQKDRHKR